MGLSLSLVVLAKLRDFIKSLIPAKRIRLKSTTLPKSKIPTLDQELLEAMTEPV